MAILRFRVYWEEDDQTYRDIEIEAHQTFFDFHKCIVKAYEFDGKHTASFYQSNDKWEYGTELNSEVLTNKKGAPALSMMKTPVSALLTVPDQKFVYVYNPEKKWVFLIELINVAKESVSRRVYPFILRTEGLAPAQYGIKGVSPDKLVEIEEKYDLKGADITTGYGSEGDYDDALTTDEEESTEDEQGQDDAQDFVE
jgi:Plasmid pRiA4b ORF-3-like protein